MTDTFTVCLEGNINQDAYTMIKNQINKNSIFWDRKLGLQIQDGSNYSDDDIFVNLQIYILHEMETLDELKNILKQVKGSETETFILMTFDNEESSRRRKYGFKSAKLLAKSQNILLQEYTLGYLESEDGAHHLSTTIQNVVLYIRNGGKGSQNRQMQEVWQRYLHANAELKLYQRLFTKFGALLMKSSAVSLEQNEQVKSFPVSLSNLNMSSDLNTRMKQATKDQTELWAKISGDYEWQKKCISK